VRPPHRTHLSTQDTSRQGNQMLKDALSNLIEKAESGRPKECKICKIVNEQDAETAELIVKTFQSNASTMSIVRALNSEGINLSREYLGEKRKVCFKDPNSNCGLIKNNKKGEK